MFQAYCTAEENFRSVNILFLVSERSENWVFFGWLFWEEISLKSGQIWDYSASWRKGYHSPRSGSENAWFLQVSTITFMSSNTLRRAE